MSAFLHGVEIIEAPDGPRPVQPSEITAIGLVGTSLGVSHEDLFLADGLRAARERYSAEGTILDAIEAIHSQGAAPPVVVVQAMDPATDTSAVAKEQLEWGVADAVIQLGNPYVSAVTVYEDLAGTSAVAAADYELDAEAGTLTVASVANVTDGDAIYVDYTHQDVSAVAIDAVVSAAAGFVDAQSELGVVPEILIAPAFTEAVTRNAAMVVDSAPGATGLAAIAERLRAVVIADGPGTTRADAIAFRDAIDSRRVMVVDPKVRVLDANDDPVDVPASARVAGLIARSDRDPARGWWASPSNQALYGVAGTSRPVSFIPGDVDSEANALNASQVSTVVRQGGWRLWGGRTCSSDPKWAFLSVVRTADRINRALLAAHLWAVDRNITRTYREEVVESVNAFLRSLVAQGAILGGRSWADPELNDAAAIAAGRIYFDFDFTPAYPAERITFRSRITDRYVETIF